MPKNSGIQNALALFDGSPSRLATACGDGVLRQHIEHWVKTGRVPADRCPLIEKATAGVVRCEELRPDVAWDVLRTTPKQNEGQGVANV